MQIFLTGATGHIGSSVLEALIRARHEVTALVRDPEKAESISRRGARPVVGDLARPASYASVSEQSDVIVHTALDGSMRGQEIDRQAIDTLLAVASSRVTSGATAAFRVHIQCLGSRRHMRTGG
jgi:uncharacterized protein YbjT (DUF2867 family)